MSLFFSRYTRCPRCGKKTAAGLKKTELRLGIWEYLCENCKNVYWIDRAYSYRLITLLLVAVFLCAVFAAYLHQAYLLLSIPILASIPFLDTDIVRDTKRFLSPIHRASTQAAIPSVCRRKAWRDRLQTAFSYAKERS